MGNPFDGTSHELMTLDSHDCVDKKAITALRDVEATGITQYSSFVKEVLVDRTVSIHEPIRKNNVLIFKHSATKSKSRTKQQMEDMKSDCSLFSQLFISSQVRDGDLEQFFMHENHPWPPSLSQHGKLRLPTCKSRLLELLPKSESDGPGSVDAKIFDGPAVVHALPRGDTSTFVEYSANIFIPWTIRQLHNCKRIDVVWDTYKDNSLKAATRKRGKGVRRKVSPGTKMPGQFAAFLQNAQNKEELFGLLTEAVCAFEYPTEKEVYITRGQSVVSKTTSEPMQSSDHEEADTRMCLHIADAVRKGATTVMVSTVDPDVVIILVGLFTEIVKLRPDVELWVAFGTGKSYRRLLVNDICEQLGEEKCGALPFFHAFTGSDTTSQFNGKAKKSCWEAWEAFPPVTSGFTFPLVNLFVPLTADAPSFRLIERFTCVLYERSSKCVEVNALRKDLFPQKVQHMTGLPPTQAALLEHVNRSLFQSSIWLQSFQARQNVPSADAFGWRKRNTLWEPVWTPLAEAATGCRQLLKCGCKVIPHCSKRCVCRSTGLPCTALCLCKGNCTA